MPKLTVLMSVYNGEDYLREAIDSILDQTLADFEFLIIDDCSTDSSLKIISSYSDPRIRFVPNEQNLGLTKSLNKGLALAKGEYIARMDADDVSLPTRLEKQAAFLDSHPDFSFVAGLYETIDENGNVTNTSAGWQPSAEQLYVDLLFGNCFPHAVVTFRTDTARLINGYDEQFKRAQDMDMWFRLSRNSAAHLFPEVLLKYRNTKGNISNFFKDEQMECARRIYLSNLKYHLGEDAPVKDLLCFENLSIYYNAPLDVTSKSIRNYRELGKAVEANAPQCLDRTELARCCENHLSSVSLTLLRNKWSLVMDAYFLGSLLRRFFKAASKRLHKDRAKNMEQIII